MRAAEMPQSVSVIFVCAKCGAGYQATQKLHTEEVNGNFHREVCHTEITHGLARILTLIGELPKRCLSQIGGEEGDLEKEGKSGSA
jgi:hypothetical protein